MCMVSNIGDGWMRDAPKTYPWVAPLLPIHPQTDEREPIKIGSDVSREEFEALKRDIEELKELLLAAKKYDEETGQPDCEVDEKVALIRKMAELVGVDISQVFSE